MVVLRITANDTRHERTMFTALNGQRRVAVVAVVGIVHVVAHEQAFVLVVLYTVDVLGHLFQTNQRHGVQTIQRLAGHLIIAQVLVNLGLLAHTHIEVVLLLILCRVAAQNVLVLRIETLELAVLLCSGTNHIERPVLRAKEVPTVYIVGIAVSVVIEAIGSRLAGIRPQSILQTDDGGINARVDDAYHHRP